MILSVQNGRKTQTLTYHAQLFFLVVLPRHRNFRKLLVHCHSCFEIRSIFSSICRRCTTLNPRDCNTIRERHKTFETLCFVFATANNEMQWKPGPRWCKISIVIAPSAPSRATDPSLESRLASTTQSLFSRESESKRHEQNDVICVSPITAVLF